MRRILINGFFLCRRLTGIERFAREVTARLDALVGQGETALIAPEYAETPPYRNIAVIKRGRARRHILWQMGVLQPYALAHPEYTVLDFSNSALPFSPCIVFLHDIYCELFPEDFITLRDKLVRLYSRLQYRLIARRAVKIATVSEFSKEQIVRVLGASPEKIAVIPNGWEHIAAVRADYAVFERFPLLRRAPFFFLLGSLSRRKNLRWAASYAASHPASRFAVSGASLGALTIGGVTAHLPPNVTLTGYLTDGEVKALMETCRAFIMPSYYEGFGIPPLEALACGAPVVISRAGALPEIYGACAHYIDPDNPDVDLDALLAEPVAPPDALLHKYSYREAARQLRVLFQD